MTQDGDDEGILRLDRLPAADEADTIRDLAAVVAPDFGEVFQKAGGEGCARANRAAVEVPDCPGCHIRPFICLLGSRAISSVSFC